MEKSSKFRVKKNKRQIYHQCPNCMSTLIIQDGAYTCTGDQLTFWKQEFKKYDLMNKKEKSKYLNNIADESRFFEMYKQGDNLNCGFNTRMVNITHTYSEQIPDPMIVKRMERKLGRQLSDEEINNIPKITFPDDV